MKTYKKFLVISIVIEFILLLAIGLFLGGGVYHSNQFSFILIQNIPKTLIILITFFIILQFVADSRTISLTMKKLRKEYRWAKSFIVPPSNFSQVAGIILMMFTQYATLTINCYWGLFVQLTIYFYVIARMQVSKEENLRLMLSDIKKAGHDNPLAIFVGCYRLKLYNLSVALLGSSFFIAVVNEYFSIFNIEYEKYDFILLYLFILTCLLFIFALMLIPGFYYSRKTEC
jgi:hypothetical protein